jgi:hypothetical protein
VLHDGRHKAIAPPGHGDNKLGRLHRVTQGSAQLANGDTNHGIAHGGLGSDGVQEFVFGDQAVWVRHQVVQHGKGFRWQDNSLGIAPQAALAGSSRKGPKTHCGEEGMTVLLAYWRCLQEMARSRYFITFLQHIYDTFTGLL